MLKDNLDKYIKENLENARVDWDKNAMWDDIEEQLPAKEKDRKGLLYLIGLLFLLMSVAICYFAINENVDNEPAVAVMQNEGPLDKNTTELNDTNAHIFSRPIIDEKSPQTDSDDVAKVKDTNTNTNTNTYANSSADLKINTIDKVKVDDLERKSNYGSEKKSIQITEEHSIALPVINPSELITIDSAVLDPKGVSIDQVFNAISLIERLESISNIGFKKLLISNRDLPNIRSAQSMIEISKAPNKSLQLGVYSGIGIADRTLQSQSNDDLLELRDQNETVLEVIRGGLTLRKKISHNFSLDAGIEYQRINERLDYIESSQTTVAVTSDSAYVANTTSGSLQYFSGKVDGVIISSQRFIRYNTHHNISVPLHVGYYTSLTPKIEVSAYAGPVINLYQGYEGYNINLDGYIVETDAISSGSILSAFDAGLSLDYGISGCIDMSIGAFYRKALTAFSIDSNVDQSYDNLNLQVGILYNFY